MPIPGFRTDELTSTELQKLVNEALGVKKENKKPSKNPAKKPTKKGDKKSAKKPAKKAAKRSAPKPRAKETLGLNYG